PQGPLLHDPPAAVGLAAGGAEGILGLAADGDRLLELAAIGAARLIGGLRRDRTGIAAIGIVPADGLARRRGVERGLRGLPRIGDTTLTQGPATLRADKPAGEYAQ